MLLTIGYHQLEGKRQQLKKPFAVLDRVQGSSDGGGGGSQGSQGSQGGEGGGDPQYKARSTGLLGAEWRRCKAAPPAQRCR